MLTKEQFEILSSAAQPDSSVSAADSAVIRQLQADGLISNGKITESGLAALEPYRVKRAIYRCGNGLAHDAHNTELPQAARARQQQTHN